ncbi:RecQ family ATP-dependent DNA helicase, partial [Calditrichota bacterium]
MGRENAEFRNGQWESIEALVGRKRLLVVQRTGWGKSLVYFLATKLLRDRGAGLTLLISPLISLMRNQILATKNLNIIAETINSSNVDEWESISQKLLEDQIDILLISPERLSNERFHENVLRNIAHRVGLFVVDEAHCISDWGHDFRPDYKRIVRILRALPSNIPLLATTATANNRVGEDVARQLGNLEVIRGPLVRNSLRLQNIWLPNPATRMAWLAETLPKIPGNGIIYTLTRRDAERVAKWLRSKGLNVRAYHSETENREILEEMLLSNDLKALVATVALGMGFDKPDLAFVVHFQRPGSVVHYYQQVGRAGRAVDSAYGVLLSGDEDKEITDYFISTAFPPRQNVEKILTILDEAKEGLSIRMLEERINVRYSDIEKVLRLLAVENPSPIVKQGNHWFRTAVDFSMNWDQVERLNNQRRSEQHVMLEYMKTGVCLMKFLSDALDDPHAEKCGKCDNCVGASLLPEKPSDSLINEAVFLKRSHQAVEPRRLWPSPSPFRIYGWKGRISGDL